MTIFSKIRWVASFLLVFFIVLITNIIDRDNFNRISYSVTTIYEDRIVASDLLFEMSILFHKKEIALLTNDSIFFRNDNNISNRELDNLISRYQETKLTEREKLLFSQLKSEIETLRIIEQNDKGLNKEKILKSIDKLNQYLFDLSKIQVQEGRRQVFISDKAKNAINLFTQVEIIFLILMAIIIQIIIFYKPKETTEK